MAPKLEWNQDWQKFNDTPSLLRLAHNSTHQEFMDFFKSLNDDELRAELEKHDPIGQNILHVAMKDLATFSMCLSAIRQLKLNLHQFITEPTQFGDNILHAFVQFGRLASLNVLLAADDDSNSIRGALQQASHQKNTHGETPLDILNNPRNSLTLAALRDDDANWSRLDQTTLESNRAAILTKLLGFRPQPLPESEDDTTSVASGIRFELDARPEQGWLNMQVMSLFVAGLGVGAVALGVIALCAPSLLVAATATYAAVGLASTVLGGIGFFAPSRPRDIEPAVSAIPPLSMASNS